MLRSFYRLDTHTQRRITFKRLRKYLNQIIYPYHPYLRQKYDELNIDVSTIKTYEDFQKLPVISKEDIRQDPRAFILQPQFPGKTSHYDTEPIAKSWLLKYAAQALLNYPHDAVNKCLDLSFKEKITRRALTEWLPMHFHMSTGSTGQPTPAVYTRWEIQNILPELTSLFFINAKDGKSPGIGFDQSVMNVFPGVPHLAFFQTVFIKLLCGASILDTGGGKAIPTERQIELFHRMRQNYISAVPSYMIYWLRKAVKLKQAGKIDDLDHFHGIYLGGEAVSKAQRKYIQGLAKQLGADPAFAIRETFGMTESRWAAVECKPESGMHLPQKHFFWELLHPETFEPVKEGEPGVLVFSHVGWRGSALIRYNTGDLVESGWKLDDYCPHCKLGFPRITSPIVRAQKDFTKIKGARVPLRALLESVRDVTGVKSCQIIITHHTLKDLFSGDKLILRILPEDGVNTRDLKQILIKNVRKYTELTPDKIHFEKNAERFEQELFKKNGIKAEYLVDLRKK